MFNSIQEEYVLGKHSILGDSRRKWEDRVFAEKIFRQGWDPLNVGIVADGVGSADFGSRGAQLAIDTVIQSLKHSGGNDIPSILVAAIEAANNVVYQDNQEADGDALSTLIVAVVFGGRAFVGNVGDSRAYWMPVDGKLLLLTRDHSYYNIYGGDPSSDEANVVVNAIGKKANVQVDLGFYLKGENIDQADQLGVAGLPLRRGDAILLCSDGLIKSAPNGMRYVEDAEIVNALKTEWMPDHAAIKMVSAAEGRRPDDNVSAVTIQCSPGHANKKLISHINLALPSIPIKLLIATVSAILFLFVLVLAGHFVNQWLQKGEPSPIAGVPLQSTFNSTLLHPISDPTMSARISYMEVLSVDGSGSTVRLTQNIRNGEQVSNLSNGGGIKLVPRSPGIYEIDAGMLYLFSQSSATILFDEKMMPELGKGAIYVQPEDLKEGVVTFGLTNKVFATVIGSRMILELKGSDIWLYCFEGDCEWHTDSKTISVPAGLKMVYHPITDTLDFGSPAIITYDEKWAWNRKCNYCMSDIIPNPTPNLVMPAGGDQEGQGQSIGSSDPTAIAPTSCSNKKKCP